MSKLRVGVDVDGCLAKFNQPYADVIQRLYPHMKFPTIDDVYYPNTWNWEKAAGLSGKQCSQVWRDISKDDSFWFNLAAYEDAVAFLTNLAYFDSDVYFITSRPGASAKEQTEDWLYTYGWQAPEVPTVLISSEKGLCCKALDLTHYIDDKNENVLAVQNDSPGTKGYMLARPWNQAQFGVPRINNLGEFIEVLRGDAIG